MNPKQLIAAGAVVGILAVGGASIASAQDSGSTPAPTSQSPTPNATQSTPPPSQSTAPGQSYAHNANCPNMGQAPASSTTPSASATSV